MQCADAVDTNDRCVHLTMRRRPDGRREAQLDRRCGTARSCSLLRNAGFATVQAISGIDEHTLVAIATRGDA